MFKKIKTQITQIKKIDYTDISGLKFTGVSDDSRNVKKGDIFFAIQGTKFDGRKFIDEAVKKGAVAVVRDKGQGLSLAISSNTRVARDKRVKGIKDICVDNPRVVLAQFASEFYGNPSKKLKVIGITGTNGKTTISYLLESIFKRAGYETGIIGTIAHKWKDTIIKANNTTPGALELQSLLANMADAGVDYCAMEVSSHSLEQERVAGIDFKTAIFTNIASEHLDYHKTFENYLEAKLRLFKGLRRDRLAVLNSDDPNFSRIKESTSAEVLTYGIKNKADIYADEIRCSLEGSEFLIRIDKDREGKIREDKELGIREHKGHGGSFKVRTPLFGDFNIYNILAAVGVALHGGIDCETIKEAVLDFKGAEGRLESVETGRDFKIFIDYAHTDDALESVLKTLRGLVRNRLIVVFGCGGDRDKFKRPRMGNVASKLADYIIITSDNPRSEEPSAIAGEIEKGIDKNFGSYEIILDRYEAIRHSLEIASADDIILIAGKGHEQYQIIGDKALPFSDREVVAKILNPNPLTLTLSPLGRGKG